MWSVLAVAACSVLLAGCGSSTPSGAHNPLAKQTSHLIFLATHPSATNFTASWRWQHNGPGVIDATANGATFSFRESYSTSAAPVASTQGHSGSITRCAGVGCVTRACASCTFFSPGTSSPTTVIARFNGQMLAAQLAPYTSSTLPVGSHLSESTAPYGGLASTCLSATSSISGTVEWCVAANGIVTYAFAMQSASYLSSFTAH